MENELYIYIWEWDLSILIGSAQGSAEEMGVYIMAENAVVENGYVN